jgi:hypothetical protein
LIQIARLIDLDKLEIISRHEITRAALEWSRLRNLDDNQRIRAARQFTAFAGRWLSFLGRLPAPPHESFEWMIRTFMSALSIRALKRATVVRHGAHVRTFFRYFPRDFEFRSTTLLDVDSFIKGKISAGWKAASVVSACYSDLQGFKDGVHPEYILGLRIHEYGAVCRSRWPPLGAKCCDF